MTFKLCCDHREAHTYKIDHRPKPKDWDKDLLDSIQMLLWYIPNIDSVQSKPSSLIRNKAYDNIFFAYILEVLGMTDDDVKFINQGQEIDKKTWDYYHDEICTSCQKILLVRRPYNTKTENLLRCIRNSVAHGDFNLVWDTFIGFNEYKGERNAIIKLKPKKLLVALNTSLTVSELSRNQMVERILRKNGYEVEREPAIRGPKSTIRPDLIVRKNDKTYIIEFKRGCKGAYMPPEIFAQILKKISEYEDIIKEPNTELVLILDDTRLTKASRDLIREKKNLKVIDINIMKDMTAKI